MTRRGRRRKPLASTRSDLSDAEGSPFSPAAGNPGDWTARGDADVDLIRELSVEAHVLDLRDCPERSLHFLKVNGEDVAAFAQAGCRQGFFAGQDSVEIEGDAPQRVFGILEEKLVERRLKPEKRRCADRGNEEKHWRSSARLSLAVSAGWSTCACARRATARAHRVLRSLRLTFRGGRWLAIQFEERWIESEAMRSQRAGKSSPATAAALGRRLVSVMPGIVLISRTFRRPFGARSTSTRE